MTKLIMNSLSIVIIGCNAIGSDIPTWMKEKKPVLISIYLGLGSSLPMGDLTDNWNKFLHGFGRLDFSATSRLSVWVGFDYNLFKPKVKKNDGLKLKITNIAFDLKLNLGSLQTTLNPFFFTGLGIAIPNMGVSDLKEREANPMIEIGSGVEYKMIFIHGRYVSIFTDYGTVEYFPITAGVKF